MMPPMIGPSAIGMRRKNEWSDTPKLRRSLGMALETRLMIAGSETAVHDMKNIEPTSTACHAGTRITIRYPNMATSVNSCSDFL